MKRSRGKLDGGAPPQASGNGSVCADRASQPSDPQDFATGSPQGHDPGSPGGVAHGKTGFSIQLSVTLPAAEARRATEREETVARPRWQRGWIVEKGKKMVGRYREDVISEDGFRLRVQRSVILGPVAQMGKREAQRKLSERLAEINQGIHKPEVRVSFERFVLERWEPNIYPTLRYSTQRNYRYLVRRYLLPFFGRMYLSEIGAADVQVFLSAVSKRIAPRTVLSLRNRLLKIFGTAKRWGYLQLNPADGAQVPALCDTKERLALTPQQARALLAELVEPCCTMVLLALLSGLRRGEIFGLRWKSVLFAEGSVLVTESSYQGRSSQPKTRASRRKVFVDQVVLDALSRLRPAECQPDDLVFHSERGTPLNPENIRNRVLAPACERAGVPRIGWHNLRYTYATWADPSGESVKALQAQLGHTDSRLTLSVYTQPMPEAQRRMAGKIARVLLPLAPKFEVEEDGENEKPVLVQ